MEGYLKRWTGLLTRWQVNYFILHKTILVYCKEKGSTTMGTIHLKISSILLIPDDPLRIIINSGTKEINLRAENINEKVKWVNALRNAQETCFKEEDLALDIDSIVKEDNNIGKEPKLFFQQSEMNGIQDSLTEIWSLQAHMEEVLSLLLPKIDKASQTNDLLKNFQQIHQK